MIGFAVLLLYFALFALKPELKARALNLLIAIDQLLWVVLTLGEGSPDETISAAMWRMEQEGKLAGRLFRPVIDAIFYPLERDHCRLSAESEKRGRHLPEFYKNA